MKLLGIYGASGCGRGVMPLARAQWADYDDCRLVFIDDGAKQEMVNGHAVMSFDEFLSFDASERRINIAIADGAVRREIAKKIAAHNLSFFEVRADNVVEMDDVSIGEGAIFSPFSVLTSNIKIGRHFHCNIQSYVEHDCVIGDFVTFAPGVRCNGNVHIGHGAYIGSGAVIKQGTAEKPLTIGENAIIGMGAVVTRNVPANSIMVGNPARPLQR
jgi:sugar O-acyltransferase (sialic acid O-acetyltransferase NeuD family)